MPRDTTEFEGRWLHNAFVQRCLGAVVVLSGLAAGVFGVWGVETVLQVLVALVFGIPAPGQPLAPPTWVAPTNGVWPEVMPLSQAIVGVAVLLLVVPLIQMVRASDARARWQAIRRALWAGAMIASTWTVLPVGLHLADQLAAGLATHAIQWTEPHQPVTVVGTLLVGLVTFIVQPVALITSLLSLSVLHALIVIGFVLWPLAWTLRIIADGTAASVGRTMTTLFTIAVVTKVLEAVLAAVLLHIDWMAGLAELSAFLLGLGLFVYLPIAMLQNAERVLRLAWLAPRSEQVGRYIEASADRIGQAHGFARDWHEARTTPTQSTIDEWTEDTSVSRWRRWIPRQFPEESYTTWGWDGQGSDGGPGPEGGPADGSFGPTSRGPDDHRSGARTQSEWHDEE